MVQNLRRVRILPPPLKLLRGDSPPLKLLRGGTVPYSPPPVSALVYIYIQWRIQDLAQGGTNRARGGQNFALS